MTTDEQLLERVHREAARRIRRRRGALSAAVVLAVIGLAAAAAAVSTKDSGDVVITTSPEVTTSTVTTSTTVPATSTTSSTSTSTTTSTTTTTVPVTTTIPPIAPVTATNQIGGLKATVTASQDRSKPGRVQLTIRVEDGHGGRPTGYVLWDGAAYTLWGDGGNEDGSGDFPGWLFGECDEVMDTDPTTNLGPDPTATSIDRTTVLTHDYGSVTGDVRIRVETYTSLCSTDEESTPIELMISIPA